MLHNAEIKYRILLRKPPGPRVEAPDSVVHEAALGVVLAVREADLSRRSPIPNRRRRTGLLRGKPPHASARSLKAGSFQYSRNAGSLRASSLNSPSFLMARVRVSSILSRFFWRA